MHKEAEELEKHVLEGNEDNLPIKSSSAAPASAVPAGENTGESPTKAVLGIKADK